MQRAGYLGIHRAEAEPTPRLRGATLQVYGHIASSRRPRQAQGRFGPDGLMLNGRMTSRLLRCHYPLDADGQGLLKTAMEDLGLSARAHDRILRVARTVADLEGADAITGGHVAEAISYRTLWAR